MSSTERRTEASPPERGARTERADGGRGRLGSVLSGAAVALGSVLFLGGFAWGAWEYQPYTVPTDSMAPSIDRGERVLAQRIDGAEVRRGDVVVFRDAGWSDVPMIKRVVGVGGDRVAHGADGRPLTVNGETIEEPYLLEGASSVPVPFDVTVPEGRLFLLGDRRSTSLDSRAHLQEAGQGTVSREAVSARVDAVAWPMDGMLVRPAGFEDLPGGVSEPGPLRPVVAAAVAGALLIVGGAAYGPVAGRRRRREA